MRLTQAAGQPTRKGAAESFTCIAWQQPVATGETARPMHVTGVTFEPGARTVWHHHQRGQILIASAGIGRFRMKGGRVIAMYPGDSVTFALVEVHRHGAASDQPFVRLSMQAENDGGEQATWLHPVSDEDYRLNPA